MPTSTAFDSMWKSDENDLHDFPPNTTNHTDYLWAIGPNDMSLLILLILVGGLAAYSFRRPGAHAGWFAAIGLSFVLLFGISISLGSPGGPGMWTLLLGSLIGVVSLFALVHTLRANGTIRGWLATIAATLTGLAMLSAEVLILPAMQGGRPAARRTQCRNNLRQLGLAMHNYHDVYSSFPAAAPGQPAASWRSRLMPYIDSNTFSERYHWDQTWDSDLNQPFQIENIPAYDCPSRPQNTDNKGRFLTAYVYPIGTDTMFADNSGCSLDNIADGSSNTLMILEACGTDIVWTEPRDVEVADDTIGVNLPGAKLAQSDGILSSYHSIGAQAVLADGSVRFIGEDMDQEILRALLSPSGHDNTGNW